MNMYMYMYACIYLDVYIFMSENTGKDVNYFGIYPKFSFSYRCKIFTIEIKHSIFVFYFFYSNYKVEFLIVQ